MDNLENKENASADFEISDDELEQVVGGLAVGDRVRRGTATIRYCPRCCKLISGACGTITQFRGVDKKGDDVFFVKMDCCGYIDSGISTTMTRL